MKYTYFYKTSDGVRHEATMDAASREAVFETLRARGIKAIKVVAADGSKANGEVRGVRKRVAAAVAVAAAAVVGIAAYFLGESQPITNHQPPTTSTPRHQIYGDPVIVERFERGDFDAVLTNRADRMLAWFAQPGKLMCPKGADPRRKAAEFASALNPAGDKTGQTRFVSLDEADPREVRELKQIVNGMHRELAAYLANGNGTPRSYWRRLLERTQQEIQIYERTRRELEKEKDEAVWERKNEALRRLGLRTIANSQEEE